MQLIQILGKRLSKSGKYAKTVGLFLCPLCGAEVERWLGDGKRCITCGCGRLTHGYTRRHKMHPLYTIWRGLLIRCYHPQRKDYQRYGNRGIQVCNTWRDDAGVFIDWALANGWREGLQIDRIDNNGNYEPGNCRFVTLIENARNRSTTKLDEDSIREIRKMYSGGELTQAAIGKIFGVTAKTISKIIRGERWGDVV